MSLKKVLIVDEDSETGLTYHILLKIKHYETFFARDSLSCLSQAHLHRPHLILMNIALDAADGFTAMEQLRAASHLSHIPIIALSAGHPHSLESLALQAGASAYLPKPVEQSKLFALISGLIGESQGEPHHTDPSDRRFAQANI